MGLITSFTRPGAETRTFIETVMSNICGAVSVVTQNGHYLSAPFGFQRLEAPITATTARIYNGATVNGNFAVDVWYSNDLLTATKLGTTGSVAQAGVNAVQSAPLTATIVIPASAYIFIGFSADSATGTYLRASTWTGTPGLKAKATFTGASYNPAGPITLNTSGAALTVWAEIS